MSWIKTSPMPKDSTKNGKITCKKDPWTLCKNNKCKMKISLNKTESSKKLLINNIEKKNTNNLINILSSNSNINNPNKII